MKGPLEGIRVLDFTKAVAGPFATFFLQELGAEIIKIELPERGDETRHFAPFVGEDSSYFASINRGKKSIALNLKDEKDKEIVWKLLAKSDVVVENFRPGTLESLGFGEKKIKEYFPQIIYASSSGFGQKGPYKDVAAYDIVMQAMSGMMSVTGEEGNEGTRLGIPLGDYCAGMMTAMGIISALYARETKKEVSRVDVSMLDSQFFLLESSLLYYLNQKKLMGATGNRHPTITPFQCYRAKDRQFALGIGNDRLFQILCKTIGLEKLLQEEKFKLNKDRTDHYKELNAILEEKFKEKTAQEWVELFESVKIPCSKINTIKDVVEHPQIKARNMIVDIENLKGDSIKAAGNPIKLSAYPDPKTRPKAPELDEHREEILKSLGLR